MKKNNKKNTEPDCAMFTDLKTEKLRLPLFSLTEREYVFNINGLRHV